MASIANRPIDMVVVKSGDLPLPKVSGRGRKRGDGCNLVFLKSLTSGDTAWGLSERKMRSVKMTAFKKKIKISIRQIPDTDTYVIKKL